MPSGHLEREKALPPAQSLPAITLVLCSKRRHDTLFLVYVLHYCLFRSGGNRRARSPSSGRGSIWFLWSVSTRKCRAIRARGSRAKYVLSPLCTFPNESLGQRFLPTLYSLNSHVVVLGGKFIVGQVIYGKRPHICLLRRCSFNLPKLKE